MVESQEFKNGDNIMNNTYESPLSARYADAEMKYLFSPDKKFRTWRSFGSPWRRKRSRSADSQDQIDELIAFRMTSIMK